MRRAITRVVDYHHSLDLTSTFGPGATAMSDGICFEVATRSLHAQYHSRHFGPWRGVTLHHETELPIEEIMVDTAGFIELMHALYELQGFKLSRTFGIWPTTVSIPRHCYG
ncbi:hypothetical protein KDI_27060 [Dictyobacter arantiisoli]|uniref:Tn3 transposase DDE domain-containing protein n=1 Tax=Dictyobacter arantiisoli TaxID=2014874 RepID=A0A5A5TCG4_9CHLR|nr:hypothetical protein KDI_27060 [Dictyobacter arantiisoli]